jgi:hypothetical protein
MRISIDYDGTYTRDPVLWDSFIQSAKDRGHEVVCVTMRYPHEPIAMPCEIFYTSRKAKAIVCEADIWIDDSPKWLLMDSA